jgi:hypothetical protein
LPSALPRRSIWADEEVCRENPSPNLQPLVFVKREVGYPRPQRKINVFFSNRHDDLIVTAQTGIIDS